ncbi:hypothetical protein NP233_g9491 [Leucocoprinus birnbaumii]|uniref:Uncharacterized protein n=1 Tax=Leucocoprinus birnbaumii TaxID=56174 RepID=A0AAD5YN52_9AGAR|nr:hypothetical protein NP233_g9491 [Leucocoprinus birnbaumii]
MSTSPTPASDSTDNAVSVFLEKTGKTEYKLSIASDGQLLTPTVGEVGDIWFACESDHFQEAHTEMERAKRCAQMSGFPGALWFRSESQWIKVDREVNGVTDIRHPLANNLILDTSHMSWRAAGSVSTTKRRKRERSLHKGAAGSFSKEATVKILEQPVVPVQYLPIPFSHPLFPQNCAFATPEHLFRSLSNAENSWMISLSLEWQAAAFFNNENREPGEEIWHALMGCKQSLVIDRNAPGRRLAINLAPTRWGEIPTIADILQEYYTRDSMALVSMCGVGQMKVALSPWRVLSTFIEGATSSTTLCSLLSVPVTNEAMGQFQPTTPVATQSAPGGCALWKDPSTHSIWEFTVVPAAGITSPHVDSWVAHTYISHLSGKKLWMMWPGSAENYQRLYAAAFQGHDLRLTVARAIEVLDGLELLLVDGNDASSWIMSPGTIHAVLTFSRIATHAGFYYMPYAGWKECRESLSVLMSTIGTVGFNGDTTAGDFLLKTLRTMPGWVEIALERRGRGEPDSELEDWITDIVPSIEAKLKVRAVFYDRVTATPAYLKLLNESIGDVS